MFFAIVQRSLKKALTDKSYNFIYISWRGNWGIFLSNKE
ncbi:hypothetical protein L289_2275 [Acinetobacter gerneri DSM 14967 = CIP 107464 = MTCC 9824]|nr:hypothetical protein L289_2275 [Acinetobacter gerneri DSM 14967 = CIP 107464 = MTCC 9824]